MLLVCCQVRNIKLLELLAGHHRSVRPRVRHAAEAQRLSYWQIEIASSQLLP